MQLEDQEMPNGLCGQSAEDIKGNGRKKEKNRSPFSRCTGGMYGFICVLHTSAKANSVRLDIYDY